MNVVLKMMNLGRPAELREQVTMMNFVLIIDEFNVKIDEFRI